jgi:hypothetical protein
VLALGGIAAIGAVAGIVTMFAPKPRPPAVAQNEPAEPETKPAAEEKKKEEPPAPKGLAIAPLEEVVLEAGGTAKVTIKIERAGAEGAIPVQLEELPSQVTAEPVEIGEGKDSTELVFTAAPEAEASAEAVKFKISVTAGEKTAQQEVALRIKPPPPPVLSTVAALTMRPGATAPLEVKVDRKGFMGPIALTFEGLPEKVTTGKPASEDPAASPESGQELTIPEVESSLKIALTAATDAAEGTFTPKVTAMVREQKIEAPLKLTIERFSFRVQPLPVVTLKPGESKTIDVTVLRRSFKGPFKLEPTGLPEKVTAAPIEIAENQTKAQLQLTAAEDAEEQVKSAALAGKANNANVNEALVIRVSKGEGGFLPSAVSVDPEFARLLKRGSFGGRLETSSKQALLKAYGGTEESENAVLKGLEWLAKQQKEDGSWSLQTEGAAGDPAAAAGAEGAAGSEAKEYGVAGTAFGVLPFLGAGVTHDQSPSEPSVLKEYRTTVFKGLGWIAQQQVANRTDPKKDGELPGGMYAHALGTIALCEGYGLSKDERLKVPAQRAIKYLIQSQHTEGGWRYGPRQPGDVSVVGWVFLAIRSGQLADLPIDRSALEKAGKFLNTCAAGPDDAKLSRYSYEPGKPPAKTTTTAAGLLSRQYLGWEKDNPDLVAGAKYLMENLPPEYATSLGQIYYYYYATQVLHHMEGEDWDKWNHRMREHLIRTQEKSGETAGSWSPLGTDYGPKAGRIYATSLALMTLEAYYRHLPLYRRTVRVAADTK